MIKAIADLIVELAKEKTSDSPVRNIYSVLREVNMETGKRMNAVLKEEKERRQNDKK